MHLPHCYSDYMESIPGAYSAVWSLTALFQPGYWNKVLVLVTALLLPALQLSMPLVYLQLKARKIKVAMTFFKHLLNKSFLSGYLKKLQVASINVFCLTFTACCLHYLIHCTLKLSINFLLIIKGCATLWSFDSLLTFSLFGIYHKIATKK